MFAFHSSSMQVKVFQGRNGIQSIQYEYNVTNIGRRRGDTIVIRDGQRPDAGNKGASHNYVEAVRGG